MRLVAHRKFAAAVESEMPSPSESGVPFAVVLQSVSEYVAVVGVAVQIVWSAVRVAISEP